MQKKIDQQCHCEGAVGDCGNLNPHNTKTVYFLRSPPDIQTLLPFLTPARADRSSSGAIFPDVIEDLVLIRQGKSFASTAKIPYDYSD